MLKVKDIMEMLNISRPTAYRWIESGELPAIQIGKNWRFDEAEMKKYIESKRRQINWQKEGCLQRQ